MTNLESDSVHIPRSQRESVTLRIPPRARRASRMPFLARALAREMPVGLYHLDLRIALYICLVSTTSQNSLLSHTHASGYVNLYACNMRDMIYTRRTTCAVGGGAALTLCCQSRLFWTCSPGRAAMRYHEHLLPRVRYCCL